MDLTIISQPFCTICERKTHFADSCIYKCTVKNCGGHHTTDQHPCNRCRRYGHDVSECPEEDFDMKKYLVIL